MVSGENPEQAAVEPSETPAPKIRWSSAVNCPRKAVYEAQGAPRREPWQKELNINFRGHSVERDVIDLIAQANCETCRSVVDQGLRSLNHPGCYLERQPKIKWPGGYLHPDAVILEPRTPIEILSSVNLKPELVDRKKRQLAGQIFYDHEAGDMGLLIIANPATMDMEQIPFHLDHEWITRVLAVTDEALTALETGTLPERVCEKPADAIGHFCPFEEHCFEGWEPEPLPEINTSQAAALVGQWYSIRKTERTYESHIKQLRRGRSDVEAELAAMPEFAQPGEYLVGGVKLRREDRRGTRTFNFDRAERDPRIPQELLDEFTKIGRPSTRWEVSAVTHEAHERLEADEFDEAPF